MTDLEIIIQQAAVRGEVLKAGDERTVRLLNQKWVDEAEEYQAFLATLPEEDRTEAEGMYQDGVSFQDIQESFE